MSDGEGRRKEKKIAPFGKKNWGKKTGKSVGKIDRSAEEEGPVGSCTTKKENSVFPGGMGKNIFCTFVGKKRKTKITTKRLFRLS